MFRLYMLLGVIAASGIAIAGAYAVHLYRKASYDIKVSSTQRKAEKVVDKNVIKKEEETKTFVGKIKKSLKKEKKHEPKEDGLDRALTLDAC